jgi:serine/threonine protein kinase
LELLGISTPLTVCALERRRGPLLLEAFLFTVWIEGGMGFDDFYRDRCAPDAATPLDPETRRALEKEVARLFRNLHSHRISHGDLKGRNVLLNLKQPGPFEPQFVDLDAMSLSPLRFRRSRVNDLSRLLFSVYPIPTLRTQVLFFREYAKGNADLWKERRVWWKAIAKRTQRKLGEKGLTP